MHFTSVDRLESEILSKSIPLNFPFETVLQGSTEHIQKLARSEVQGPSKTRAKLLPLQQFFFMQILSFFFVPPIRTCYRPSFCFPILFFLMYFLFLSLLVEIPQCCNSIFYLLLFSFSFGETCWVARFVKKL